MRTGKESRACRGRRRAGTEDGRTAPVLPVALVLLVCLRSPLQGADGPALETVRAATLCVTLGHVREVEGSMLEVDTPALRSTVAGSSAAIADLSLVYRGPTEQVKPLASGELRRQFAVMLRAEDECNLMYAGWEVAPKPRLGVLLKRNPGQGTHLECRDRGYRRLEPDLARPVPELRPGESHHLRTEIDDGALRLFVDSDLVWEARLPPDALSLRGPIGIRTDNARFRFRLATPREPSWWESLLGARCP